MLRIGSGVADTDAATVNTKQFHVMLLLLVRRLSDTMQHPCTVIVCRQSSDNLGNHKHQTHDNHVLQPYLRDRSRSKFILESHSKTLITKATQLFEKCFILRKLYKIDSVLIPWYIFNAIAIHLPLVYILRIVILLL